MTNQPRRRTVSVRLESTLESMDAGEDMARKVAGEVGFDEDEQYRISLAVRECLINALEHGNKSDSRKSIGLDIECLPDCVVFTVTDQGEGFDPGHVPDPREDEHLLADSGRGIFLMRTFMDRVEVTPAASGGTRVTLTKNFSLPN